ncbi:MAG: hypothetical protein K0S78_1597 [Thermomicrobiales bacterium]|jgi:hypothetical protein|nr:hypothetical protein [Thermomicrobiales bacterium]MDF3041302.1 hypothetical protein [Thermomicrobiales bacterium]
MRRMITGTVAFVLTLVALGLSQPATSLAAPETVRSPFTAEALGGASGGVLGDRQPAVRLGGASGGVLSHIGEEIPQTV